jgi:hypothetical protein
LVAQLFEIDSPSAVRRIAEDISKAQSKSALARWLKTKGTEQSDADPIGKKKGPLGQPWMGE